MQIETTCGPKGLVTRHHDFVDPIHLDETTLARAKLELNGTLDDRGVRGRLRDATDESGTLVGERDEGRDVVEGAS